MVAAMALPHQPRAGDIVICEFPDCFEAPEMTKTRAVIVVSPRLPGRSSELVTVVPISRSQPYVPGEHHCRIPIDLLPKFMQSTGGDRWAKCDMLYTLSTRRLSLIEIGPRDRHGHRAFDRPRLDLATLLAVRRAIAAGVGIDTALRVRSPVVAYWS